EALSRIPAARKRPVFQPEGFGIVILPSLHTHPVLPRRRVERSVELPAPERADGRFELSPGASDRLLMVGRPPEHHGDTLPLDDLPVTHAPILRPEAVPSPRRASSHLTSTARAGDYTRSVPHTPRWLQLGQRSI